jgi:hypothetical protein
MIHDYRPNLESIPRWPSGLGGSCSGIRVYPHLPALLSKFAIAFLYGGLNGFR